jgi:hypothetical protein
VAISFFFGTARNNVSNEFISFTSIPHVRNLYCRTGVYIYYTWQTRALVFKTQQSKTARGQYSTIFIFNRNFLAFPFLISFTDIMRNNQHRARPPTAGGSSLYCSQKEPLSCFCYTLYKRVLPWLIFMVNRLVSLIPLNSKRNQSILCPPILACVLRHL